MVTPSLHTQSRFVLVPGLRNSDEGHWQTHLERRYKLERVVLPRWDVPDVEVWLHGLTDMLARSSLPTFVIAHSFGCLATALLGHASPAPIAGALLVAPADPRPFNLGWCLPQSALPFPTILVGSRNDPWMAFEEGKRWAAAWESEFVDLGAAGHINTASGFGEWEEGWSLALRLRGPTEAVRPAAALQFA